MKYIVYLITFFAYCSVHMMRMCLPFVQINLQNHFRIHNLQMGIANAMLYVLIGVSSIIVSINPIKNFQFTYFWTMLISNLAFLVIPLLIFFQIRASWTFLLALTVFGWFQSASWPILLATIKSYFSPHQDGCMLGLWSSNKDLGNIFGFSICTAFIIYFKLHFSIALVFCGVFSVILTFLFYKLKIDEQKKNIIEQSEQQHIWQQYKKIFSDKFAVFMLIMLCMLKALIYGILLWLPMYFQKSGFKQFEGIIPIAMGIMGILGSVCLGIVYQKVDSLLLKSIILMVTFVLPAVCFFVIKNLQFTIENKIIILLLISIIGFCITGNFNILVANQVTLACDRLNIKVIIFSSLSIGTSSVIVGLIQIIIGKFAKSSIFLANLDANSVFKIYFIMALVLVGFQLIRQIVVFCYFRKKKEQNNLTIGQGQVAEYQNYQKL